MVRLKWQTLKTYLPRVRFLTLHYAYFIGVCVITSPVFWATSSPGHSVRYIDSLFMTTSAMTLAGLNTVNLSTLNTFQQVLLFFLIMSGSAMGYYIRLSIWVSIAVLLVRKAAFEKRFKAIVKEERLRRQRAQSSISFGHPITWPRTLSRQPTTFNELGSQPGRMLPRGGSSFGLPISTSVPLPPERSQQNDQEQISMSEPSYSGQPDPQQADFILPAAGSNAESTLANEVAPNEIDPGESNSNVAAGTHLTFTSPRWEGSEEISSNPVRRPMRSPYINVQSRHNTLGHLEQGPFGAGSDEETNTHLRISQRFGRNSTFHNLSEAERQQLGGAEYRAVSLLLAITPAYFILWQLLGGIGVAAYISVNKSSVTEANGVNPWWTGFFFAISAFNNSGLSLVDANMVPFRTSTYMLITMGLLILAGNTCYPIFLRWILYIMQRLLPHNEYFDYFRETLTFLLDHPRRCYTTLFPSVQTWWLLLSVIVLNGIDWIAFEVLNLDNPEVNTIPQGSRVLDGLFQALSVRTGGFSVVSISALRIGTQIIYVVMMYISIYPVTITMRHSNVYEERSLGIYADDKSLSEVGRTQWTEPSTNHPPAPPAAGKMNFIQQQLRAQMAFDLWWIALAVIIISIVEEGQFTRDPVTYSPFNIIFETTSAYGGVGISTGLPNQLFSFSGGWHTLSKLVLCAVMIRGRHRGLPVAIDKAIMLPSDSLIKAEEEDAQIRMERTMSRTNL